MAKAGVEGDKVFGVGKGGVWGAGELTSCSPLAHAGLVSSGLRDDGEGGESEEARDLHGE